MLQARLAVLARPGPHEAVVCRRSCLSGFTFCAIGNHVRGNSQQPCAKRRAGPFKFRETRKRFPKDLASQIFCQGSFPDAARDEPINQSEISFVHRAETGAILLRRLYEAPLISLVSVREK